MWGAAWLHKATKNPMYLNYIKLNGQTLGAADSDNIFGWDNKHVGARILLSKVQNHPFSFTGLVTSTIMVSNSCLCSWFQEFLVRKVQSLHDYKGHADNFICSVIPGSSSSRFTPGKLLLISFFLRNYVLACKKVMFC